MVRGLRAIGAGALAVALVAACGPAAAPKGSPASAPASAAASSAAGGPGPGATEPPPTSLQLALAGIHEDGTYSKDTALAAFVASFGPVPGVTAPTSTDEVESGTLAIDMVATYWSELTDQQQSAIRDWIGVEPADIALAAYEPNVFAGVDRAAVDQAAADIAARVGHPLTIPIVIVPPDPQDLADNPASLAWTVVRYDAAGKTPQECDVTVGPKGSASPGTLRFTLLHELWHCFQGVLVDRAGRRAAPGWLREGEAQWVAESITNGAGAPGDVQQWWWRYIANPEIPLEQRTYDAVGFFAQLEYSGNDPWKLIEPMFAVVSSDAALAVAGYVDPAFQDGVGSSFYRDGQPSKSWAMTSMDGILPADDVFKVPDGIQLQDDDNAVVDAPALAANIGDLHTRAFVTEVQGVGSVRVGDKAGGGIDEAVDNETIDLCTASSGDCTCPPGTITKPTPRRAPPNLRVAVTGGLKQSAHAFLMGISKEKWCKGSALNLTVEGEIGGQRYSGLIAGYPAPRLTCDPFTNGNAVHWSGQAQNTKNEIGGEFDMEFGTWTVGDAIGDRPISIFGEGTPRHYLGGISGTVTKSASGGSIDATAADGPDVIHIKGTWTCQGPTPGPSR